MGWKAVREHYRIAHYVCVTTQGICIGSGYIHNLIVVGLDGTIKKRYDRGSSINEDLFRYQQEMDVDPDKLRELVTSIDKFEKAIPVYTYDGGQIIEKLCEETQWPNVAHDGSMMYENLFSTDKKKVIAWAKHNADLGIKYAQEHISEAEKRLEECRSQLYKSREERNKLEADYPEEADVKCEISPEAFGLWHSP